MAADRHWYTCMECGGSFSLPYEINPYGWTLCPQHKKDQQGRRNTPPAYRTPGVGSSSRYDFISGVGRVKKDPGGMKSPPRYTGLPGGIKVPRGGPRYPRFGK